MEAIRIELGETVIVVAASDQDENYLLRMVRAAMDLYLNHRAPGSTEVHIKSEPVEIHF